MAVWLIDLDGVMWTGAAAVPGSAEAVQALLARGETVVFCTNHAMSPASKIRRLESIGVRGCPVVTSADAAAECCSASDSVLVLGEQSLVTHLQSLGLGATDVADLDDGAVVDGFDVVVVGGMQRWDRSRIGMAADAVRSGARFLVTNDDATFPTAGPSGLRLLPGNGALAAAVATASGRLPEVAGKPHRPMADVVVRRYGRVDVVVGDRPSTDGVLASALDARFGLVLSGVTTAADLPAAPDPWCTAEDLSSLVSGAHR